MSFEASGRVTTRVGEAKGDLGALATPDLEAPIAVDIGHYDIAVARRQLAVDHREVTVEEAGEHLAVARDPYEEGGGPVGDQQSLQVDPLLDEVVGRAGKARAVRISQLGRKTWSQPYPMGQSQLQPASATILGLRDRCRSCWNAT
ncbi:hypothetical protein FHU13_000159 [Methylobacterium sp. R2-1]|nr:hypothetical protein [Methylobacterium sp. R2-1]